MSPATPFPVNRPPSPKKAWTPAQPLRGELHCTCGLSQPYEVPAGDEGIAAAQAFTSFWWRTHCGPGHDPSPVHVKKPTEAETLAAYVRLPKEER